MAKTKNIIEKVLLIFLFLVFPLGQIPRFDLYLGDYYLALHAIDFVVISIALIYLHKRGLSRVNFTHRWFFLYLIFSFIFSYFYFGFTNYIRGLLYLIRMIFYYIFIINVSEISQVFSKKTVLKSFEICLYITALFGWMQYFLFPDLRGLIYFGWDDHLYRLAGTFLDPGFTGVIFSLSSVFFLWLYFFKRNNFHLFSFLFFAVTTLFTYSRASILSLLAAITVFIFFTKYRRWLIIFSLFFVFSLFILPRPSSSGVQLERFYSINSRIGNYKESIAIFSKSPLFGVGFNNICSAREKYGLIDLTFSHSCSGSDSSILQILATTGIIGILIFISILREVFLKTKNSENKVLYLSLGALILVHSLFVNSLFYPWVIVLLSFMTVLSKKSYFQK